MRILLTGGAGYIGSITARELLRRGHDVVVYDNLSTGHREAVPSEAIFLEGDLADQSMLSQVFRRYSVEAVMHFAASSIVSESVAAPSKYYNNNVGNGLNLLEAVVASRVNRFIFSSTAAVYGAPQETLIKEEHLTAPTNPYGETKLAFEKALNWYAKVYGITCTSLRYFNAAGALPGHGEDHFPETHLIPLVLQTALGKRKKITIYGTDYPTPDGTCIRDYIHVQDLALAHILALESLRPSPVYNLGNGKGYSVLEVIQTAEKVIGKSLPVEYGPRREGDPPVLVASSEKISRELGWRPQITSLEEIIQTAWQWHRTHPEGYRTTWVGAKL